MAVAVAGAAAVGQSINAFLVRNLSHLPYCSGLSTVIFHEELSFPYTLYISVGRLSYLSSLSFSIFQRGLLRRSGSIGRALESVAGLG